MARGVAWIREHPAGLGLIAALVVGQILARVLQPWVEQSYSLSDFPVLPALALALCVLAAVFVVVFRVQLGHELLRASKTYMSLPRPETLPARYAVDDPPRQVVSGGLALLDVLLILLVQSTVRGPVLVLAERSISREWAQIGFVVLVLVACLLVLGKLYRAGGPVFVLLLWWGLDRVVPTAGFLATTPTLVVAHTTTFTGAAASGQATVVAPEGEQLEPTVVAANREQLDPTVVATNGEQLDPTVVASNGEQLEPTVVAGNRDELEPTVVAPSNPEDDQATVVAP